MPHKIRILLVDDYPMVNDGLRLCLETRDNIDVVDAKMEDNELILSLSHQEAEQWIKTDQVGIETTINLSNNDRLHILIEKDFPCLDRPQEDKSDTYWELAPKKPEAC